MPVFEGLSAASIISGSLPKIAGAVAGVWAKKFFLDRGEKGNELKIAAKVATEEFLSAIALGHIAAGDTDNEIKLAYSRIQDNFESFLCDDTISGELFKPINSLTGQEELSARIVEEKWVAFGLPILPIPFSVLVRNYTKSINRNQLLDRELRSKLQVQIAERQALALERMLGSVPAFDIRAYAQRMRMKYSVLDLSALEPLDASDPTARISLVDVFIQPQARLAVRHHDIPREYQSRRAVKKNSSDPPPDEIDRVNREWMQAKPCLLLQEIASQTQQKLVILGDAGAGKSTFLKYILLRLLSNIENPGHTSSQEIGSISSTLPFLIELRDYARSKVAKYCHNFVEYLNHMSRTQGYNLEFIGLKEYLQDNESLFMFDGLDEVLEPRLRKEIIAQIASFSEAFPKARILITSRLVGYDGAVFKQSGFSHATLEDFSETEAMRFVSGWFSLIYPGQIQEADKRTRRVQFGFDSSAALKVLSGNPLLLTMICIVARHQDLPRNRAKLYDLAIKVLVFHWDVSSKFDKMELPDTFMGEDHKVALLRRLAWKMIEIEGALSANIISERELQKEIELYFSGDDWDMRPREYIPLAREMIDHLRSRNFIFCLRGSKLYGFVHRTFLEYLVATEIGIRFEKERTIDDTQILTLIDSKCEEESWREILRLLCGYLSPAVASRVVEHLLDRAQRKKDSIFYPLLALAAECLGEIHQPARVARSISRIVKWSIDLYSDTPSRLGHFREFERFCIALAAVDGTAMSADIQHWIGKRGKPSFRGYRSEQIYIALAQAARLSVEVINDKVRHLLKSPLSDDRMLAMGVFSVTNKIQAQEVIQNLCLSEPDDRVRCHAITVLGRTIKEDARTQTFLLSIMRSDKSPQVRAAAIDEFLFGHTPVQGAAKALIEVYFNDEATEPRVASLRALRMQDSTEEWREISLHAIREDNVDVRASALQNLAMDLDYQDQRILTRVIDAVWPWLDPREEIRESHIKHAAETLGKSTAFIRERLLAIAEVVPIQKPV